MVTHLMPFIFAILLSGPGAWATPKRAWNCQISASLTGAGDHFVVYGQDAWNGEGSLYCESSGLNVYRTVAVSFNSSFAGFGADRNSALQLMINLDTQMNPNQLKLQAPVFSPNPNQKVEWHFESELTRADVYVTYSTPSYAKRSLRRGTIFIRSSGE